MVVLFQPELRRAFVKMGIPTFVHTSTKGIEKFVDELSKTVEHLAKNKHGAIITIEREGDLQSYIDEGVKIDAVFTQELATSIFYPGSPLHDGAIIIRNGHIASAGCLFPFTENDNLPKTLGARHRAAIGITELVDAITIVVSEETSKISQCMSGSIIHNISIEELKKNLLNSLARDKEKSGAIEENEK
jgi:diadenylate cyclase